MNQQGHDPKVERRTMRFSEFLEEEPPGAEAEIQDLYTASSRDVNAPPLQLHCTSELCNGERLFDCGDGPESTEISHNLKMTFLQYVCKNCQQSRKIFTLITTRSDAKGVGVTYKIGEFPPFGPPVPPRVIKLIGPDRDFFIKGRCSENQGLGIGAFAYYRRVVENQKDRLISEIIRVAKKSEASPDVIHQLEAAKNQTQFSKAVGEVKDAIPEVLLINGHNPLTLLHKALSKGLHSQSDDECLEVAMSIRLVLTELAERIGVALKDQAELTRAVGRLLDTGSSSAELPNYKGEKG